MGTLDLGPERAWRNKHGVAVAVNRAELPEFELRRKSFIDGMQKLHILRQPPQPDGAWRVACDQQFEFRGGVPPKGEVTVRQEQRHGRNNLGDAIAPINDRAMRCLAEANDGFFVTPKRSIEQGAVHACVV